MKIGFDAKRAVQNLTGLGNYSRLIIDSIAREYPQDSLTLFAPRTSSNPRLSPILALPNVSLRLPLPGEKKFGASMWRTFKIPHLLRAEGIELFHGLSNELPLNIASAGIPSVLTMHDVIYRRMPECYSALDRKLYNYKYGRSCQNATRIIAISECTKRDIMHFYRIPEEKIDVIYQGCDEIFKAEHTADEIAQIKREYSLPTKYLVQVGSIEKRKNALLSVQALSALPTDIHLMLIGRSTPYLQEVLKEAEKLGVSSRLHIIHNASFPHLPLIYKGAELTLYPSRYEGFGLPVLEAISCGTPCIAATGSCLEEAGGEGALYVNPDSAEELSQAIKSILTNPDKRQALQTKGAIQAARFDNNKVAAATMNTYRKAIYEFGKR